MRYCDKAGMVARFGEEELVRLTAPETSVIDDATLNAALDDASDEINSYLAVRYTLPLVNTPELLVRLCADIARYRLYDDRMLDEVEKRYQNSVKLLKEIARGTASLPINSPITRSEIKFAKGRHDRVFTHDKLESF